MNLGNTTSPLRAVLKKLESKQMTMEEFEYEIACAAMESLEELKPTPYPVKPSELLHLDTLPSKQVKDNITPDFWKQQKIQDYMKARDSAFAENNGRKWWLKELIRIFEKDPVNKAKCQEILNKF